MKGRAGIARRQCREAAFRSLEFPWRRCLSLIEILIDIEGNIVIERILMLLTTIRC